MDAKFQLGYCYDEGIGTDINKELELKLIKQKHLSYSKKNHLEAQNFLGILYKRGDGVGKDLKKSFYWIGKAAEKDDVAQYNLGEYYELGNGIDKDLVLAFELYKKSAENGYIGAKFYLGYCYAKEKGFELYNEAADLGLSQPANNTSSNNEIYGVIPYIAPEIFQEFVFSKESDIYDYVGTYTREIRLTFDKWSFKNKNVEEFNQAEVKRLKLLNSKKLVPNPSIIWHPNENNTGSLNVLPTVVASVKKRNIEESNIKTQ
ncbi:hypothetical protein C1645_839381 [Glomus cerebriforme]|uniref:HCP-like protein n=1 Tax=Glomus cerebriforme TaxID=658196 RepID=A0A397S0U2_9GLOM|nr:hypothetical protein C1645_839381 [Glomus cerebriforme]